jgi:hypothetical protein
MCANYTRDATGQATHLEYIKTSNCSEPNPTVWYSQTITPAIRGEMMSQTTTLASETYNYDTTGRLTEVHETPSGEYCKTRIYNYDEESNRTSLTSREPNSKHECATEGGTTEKHSYDEANRLTDEGVEYDPFANITKLPAADAEGHEITTSYYADNAVASQSQNGTTNEYGLDPSGRVRKTTSNGKTSTTHYDGPGEAIAWTSENTEHWTREIPGIDGTLTAIQTNGAIPVLELHDLQGDIVATAALSQTETKLLSSYNSTEFGSPNGKQPPKYAWLGATGISSELASGVITTGATSYIPQTGRALQAEQVEPPGLPDGSGAGAPYISPEAAWNWQNVAAGAAESPGLEAAREREAEEAACRANPSVCSEDPAWSGDVNIRVAESLSGALEGIEYAYYLGGGKIVELAEKAVEYLAADLHVNFLSKLKEVFEKGLFGYSLDEVATWSFAIGSLLDDCTKILGHYKNSNPHCWLYMPTVIRHAYKGGPGLEIPDFGADVGWEDPDDLAIGYCPYGRNSACYDTNGTDG